MENEHKDLKINNARALTDNELIAKFMGLPLTKEMPEFGTGNWKEVPSQKWKYHESWDWLMDVVEKIERLGNCCEIGITKCKIYSVDYNVETTYGATKIQAVFNAVVDYIKWYNSERMS